MAAAMAAAAAAAAVVSTASSPRSYSENGGRGDIELQVKKRKKWECVVCKIGLFRLIFKALKQQEEEEDRERLFDRELNNGGVMAETELVRDCTRNYT